MWLPNRKNNFYEKKIILIIGFLSIFCADICLVEGQKKGDDLKFYPDKFQTKTLSVKDKTFKVRAYENIVYVRNPVDATYQIINIYIPEEYFSNKSVNGYTAASAPIFFPNQIGGYMPAKPATTEGSGMGMMPPLNGQVQGQNSPPQNVQGNAPNGGEARTNSVVSALARGYVVASAGARGRTSANGKAPAAIVDLKAAIRYLKYNDQVMPGDAGKIFSNGTSAGGAMSALLGATGNNPDYAPYLNALGAAPGKDDIFAVSAYCPITNLDHADAAYEWQFYGISTYRRGGPTTRQNTGVNTLTAEQIKVSEELKKLFPDYVNSLRLRDKNGKTLTLGADGNGSFKELVKSYVAASAQTVLDGGKDMSSYNFLTVTGGKVTNLDWDKYLTYLERQKTPPAFDALDLSTPETQVFGTATVDKQHFTVFSQAHTTVAGATLADPKIIKMMNPMNYIGAAKTNTAKHWRVRHGTKDKDTGLAIPVLLGTMLQNKNYDVDLALPWDRPHSGDYDLDELFRWIDKLAK